jgi:hypothetical protein
MRRLVGLIAGLVGVVSAECGRAPPEEFPQRPVQTAATSAPPAKGLTGPVEDAIATARRSEASGRCVLTTPAVAPQPVASGPAVGCPPDPEPNSPALPVVHLGFPDVSGVSVEAEFVRSEHDTARGLMYRKELGENRGMLFDLRMREDHRFWMHNTCIPLDMLFVDFDGLIVGIAENVPTLNDESRGVGCPSRWVLEVSAGWARRHGVKAGQHMGLPAAG